MSNLEHSLIVLTDSYAGNHDDALLTTLFGYVDTNRSNPIGAMERWMAAFPDEEFRRRIFDGFLEERIHDEYGHRYYDISPELSPPHYNSVVFFVANEASERIPVVVSHLKMIFDEGVEIEDYAGKRLVKILEYHVKISETVTACKRIA